jgi:hypothetical protein
MLQILALRGLAGFNGDEKWSWLPHDADWIYQGGPTGHLHDEYFNQYVTSDFGTSLFFFATLPFLGFRWDDFDTSPVTWHIDSSANIKSDPEQSSSWITTVEPWQSSVNGIY